MDSCPACCTPEPTPSHTRGDHPKPPQAELYSFLRRGRGLQPRDWAGVGLLEGMGLPPSPRLKVPQWGSHSLGLCPAWLPRAALGCTGSPGQGSVRGVHSHCVVAPLRPSTRTTRTDWLALHRPHPAGVPPSQLLSTRRGVSAHLAGLLDSVAEHGGLGPSCPCTANLPENEDKARVM
jgi:hypothetical protein